MKHDVFVSITCSKSMSVEIDKDNPTDLDLNCAVLEQNENLPGMQGDWVINDFVVIKDETGDNCKGGMDAQSQ